MLASLFFIYRMSELTRVDPIALPPSNSHIEAFRLYGALFFGSVAKLEPLTDPARHAEVELPRVMILDLVQLISLDTTGLGDEMDCRDSSSSAVANSCWPVRTNSRYR